MSLTRLVRLGIEAEGLRLKALVRRQAMRAVFAAAAVVFLLAALAVAHVLAVMLLAPHVPPIAAVAIVLAADIVIAVALLLMARGGGGEGADEREARLIRDRARQQVLSTATTLMIVPRVARMIGMERFWRLAATVFGARMFSKWRR